MRRDFPRHRVQDEVVIERNIGLLFEHELAQHEDANVKRWPHRVNPGTEEVKGKLNPPVHMWLVPELLNVESN